VPSAIRHDREFKDQGLVTILVESQGNDERTLTAFLWKTFPDNGAFTCTGVGLPIPPSRGIPHAAVIGVDGTILWAGNPNAGSKRIDELIAQELEKVKKGWGDTTEAKKVRALLYGKHDFASAMALVEALNDGDERAMLLKEVESRRDSATKAIAELKRQGRYVRAQDRAEQLVKSCEKRADWLAAAKQELAAFDSDEAKALLALDKKIEKVEKQLRDKKDENAQKGIAALLKGATESAVAARARALLEALKTKVE
jgi:hypothetical protein